MNVVLYSILFLLIISIIFHFSKPKLTLEEEMIMNLENILNSQLSSGNVLEFDEIPDGIRVILVKSPIDTSKESFTFFPPENDRMWPHYYYSFPYNSNTGIWPESMYTRLRGWSPGNYIGTGWRYEMRPGISYRYFARNNWIRAGKDYMYLDNLDDLKHSAEDYNKVMNITHY